MFFQGLDSIQTMMIIYETPKVMTNGQNLSIESQRAHLIPTTSSA